MYDNYVFDLYGTLIDIYTDETKKIVWKQMALFYRYSGIVYNWQDLKDKYFEIVDKETKHKKYENSTRYSHETYPEIKIEDVFGKLYEEKGVVADNELVKKTAIHFRRITTRRLKLYKGVTTLLEELKNRGAKLYLLSNAQRVFTDYEMEGLGLAKYFDGIIISSDEGIKKPDKDFAELLHTRFGVDFSKSLMIGNDADADINCAKKVGMDGFYIHTNISPKGEKAPINCKFSLTKMDMKKVLDILTNK